MRAHRRCDIRPRGRFNRAPPEQRYRVNRRIRVPEVRVINQDGQQLGVMPTSEALRIAEAGGLDLVEVSPKAAPPVCKIMDYGRFKYEKSKQAKAAKKHQSTVTVKEIKLRPKTDTHDVQTKVRLVNRFLGEGNKCKLVVQFRGREIVHPETGQQILQRLVDDIEVPFQIEQQPQMEGRRMMMLLAPKVGVVRRPTKSSEKGSEKSADEPAEESSETPAP